MQNLVKIVVTYQSKILTEKFFQEHPEIHALYPSKEKFIHEIYLPLLKKAEETQTVYQVEISENGIAFNGVMQ